MRGAACGENERGRYGAGRRHIQRGRAGAPRAGSVLQNGSQVPESRQESLGTRIIEGVQAEGVRSTTTIPAGAIGNERPIEIVDER